MVLESLVNPHRMEKTPRRMFIFGFFYSTVGLFLSYFLFGTYASILSIFLTTMPLIVIMYKTIRLEEEKDKRVYRETFLIKEHGRALSMFVCLFLGLLASYSLWCTILPDPVVERLFSFQIQVIESIEIMGISGTLGRTDILVDILINNFRVLFFCIIFSFLYGAGAIFILTLNASVIGVAVGNIIRNSIAECAGSGHLEFIRHYFQSFSISLCYLIHGIPEVSAYFLGALGGGIISVAVANHDLGTKEFGHILIDSLDLLILACLLLFVAGLIEVYVTPIFL
ncbi:MAG: hypothetical protein DRO62_00830 [Candidatus Altiarchaeales archaeon]|nr:MAG: hypothetical protein DRO62_00830 [Candidatus Altiarchaeales archaeon]